MKIIYGSLLIVVLLGCTAGAQQVSVEDFKKIKDVSERWKIVEHAPPEQRQELEKIHTHLMMAEEWGGEDRFRARKETAIAKARGFPRLELVFHQYDTFWGMYISDTMVAKENVGMKPQQLQEAEMQLRKEGDAVDKQVSDVHALVYNLAPTPAALALEKRAEDLSDKFAKRMTWDGVGPNNYQPITINERKGMDQQMNEIYAELQALPKLPSDQVQKESDAMTDDDLARSPWK
jgi:hypothetical protein